MENEAKVVRRRKRVSLDRFPKKPCEDVHFKRFEREYGREHIIKALALMQDEDIRMKRLLEAMLEPENEHHTFALLATRVGVSLGMFLDETKKVYVRLGLAHMARHAPRSMNDIALDAFSGKKPCWKCKGTGSLKVGEEELRCSVCKGSGVSRVPGDKDSRAFFLEALGAIGKSGGVVVNQQFNSVGGGTSFEAIISQGQKALNPGEGM